MEPQSSDAFLIQCKPLSGTHVEQGPATQVSAKRHAQRGGNACAMCNKCFNGLWCLEEQKVRSMDSCIQEGCACALASRSSGNARKRLRSPCCAPSAAQQLDKFVAGFVKKKKRFTSPAIVPGAQAATSSGAAAAGAGIPAAEEPQAAPELKEHPAPQDQQQKQ